MSGGVINIHQHDHGKPISSEYLLNFGPGAIYNDSRDWTRLKYSVEMSAMMILRDYKQLGDLVLRKLWFRANQKGGYLDNSRVGILTGGATSNADSLHCHTGGAPAAHKDSHDPEDGGDPLDTAAPAEMANVQAAGIGVSHSLARADHQHQVQHSIADNHLLTVDGSPNAAEYAKFTANGLEGKTFAEVRSNLNVEDNATADQTGAEIKAAYEVEVNAFTDTQHTKLAGIAEGAEVNVQSDWNAVAGDAFIQNKPSIPTVSDVAYDATSWNANTDAASKNAIRDKVETMDTAIGLNTAKVTNADHTGEVTGSGALTIADDAVTYAKMQDVSATDRLLGRDTAGAGIVEEITPANVRTMLNVADGATADQTGAEIKTAYEAEADTNAYNDAAVNKLAGIAEGAEVNVQSDWNAGAGDAHILNKPSLTVSDVAYNEASWNANTDAASKNAIRDKVETINTAVALNTTHSSSDGSDHADVVSNTTHRGLTNNPHTVTAAQVGVEAGADVTDATNVNAAGATMNADADVSGNSWVLDEDAMGSDSATKVATQQSVKAYVDALSGGPDFQNLTVTIPSNSTVDVDFDKLQVGPYQLTSGNLTIDIAAAGAKPVVNGLDAGAEAALTWYAIYVIYKPSTSTIAGLLSADNTAVPSNSNAPTLPAGYTVWRHIGWVRNDSSQNFYFIGRLGSWMEYSDHTNTFGLTIDSAWHRGASGYPITGWVPPGTSAIALALQISDGSINYSVFIGGYNRSSAGTECLRATTVLSGKASTSGGVLKVEEHRKLDYYVTEFTDHVYVVPTSCFVPW